MQFLTLLTTAAGLIASTSAAPATSSSNKDYQWSVSNWEAGCARAGCYYNFNVTGTKNGNAPAFKAYCNGDDVGYFTSCQLLSGSSQGLLGPPDVAAELDHYNTSTADGIARLAVSLSFTTDAQYP